MAARTQQPLLRRAARALLPSLERWAGVAPEVDGATAAVTAAPGRPTFAGLGASGVQAFAGRINPQDPRPELNSLRERARIYRDAIRQDPVATGLGHAVGQTLAGLTWEIVPASVPEDEREHAAAVAKFCAEQLGLNGERRLMARPMSSVVAGLARYVWLGVGVHEELYGVRDGRVFLADLVPISMLTHDRWELDDRGRPLGFVQRTQGDIRGSGLPVPLTKCVLLTLGGDGDPQGEGLFRGMLWPSEARREAWTLLLIALQRAGVGVPQITWDFDKLRLTYPDDEARALVAAAQTQAGDLADGRLAVLSLPAGIDSSLAFSGADTAKILSVIQALTVEELFPAGASFMTLGMGGTGSRAVGEVHHDVWRTLLSGVADSIGGALCGPPAAGSGTLGRLVRWTYGEEALRYLPTLTHTGLDMSALTELLGQVPALIGAGALTPDAQLEANIRGTLEVAALADGDQRSPEERLPATGGVAGMLALARARRAREGAA